MVRPGKAWRGAARPGKAGGVWLGGPRQGPARSGKVRRGVAGEAGLCKVRLGGSWPGRHGMVGQDWARHGETGLGMAGEVRYGGLWWVMARCGVARSGRLSSRCY